VPYFDFFEMNVQTEIAHLRCHVCDGRLGASGSTGTRPDVLRQVGELLVGIFIAQSSGLNRLELLHQLEREILLLRLDGLREGVRR
jgi:hypothetical protein